MMYIVIAYIQHIIDIMDLFYADAIDDRILDVNTTAIIKGGKVAMLHLAKRGGGVIVNTASIAGVSSSFISFYYVVFHIY